LHLSPHKRNLQIFANLARQFIHNFPMSRHLGLAHSFLVDTVASSFTQQYCAMRPQVLDELASFHLTRIHSAIEHLPTPVIRKIGNNISRFMLRGERALVCLLHKDAVEVAVARYLSARERPKHDRTPDILLFENRMQPLCDLTQPRFRTCTLE